MDNQITDQPDELVRLSYFTEIAKGIVTAKTLKETLQTLMEKIGEFFAPHNWSLLLRDQKTGNLRFELVVGSGMDVLKGKEIPGDSGIAGWVVRTGQSAIVDDVGRDERFSKQVDDLTGFITKSIIAVPLKSGDQVFGVIELVNKLNHEAFSAKEMKLLTTIADFTAIAVEKHYYLGALRRVATVDSLTMLYNRRYFQLSLERERARSARTTKPFSIIEVDVKQFEQLNKLHGQAFGDEVLKRLARLLVISVRRMDVVCRVGNASFAILLPETDLGTAEAVAERLRSGMSEENSRSLVGFDIAIAVGVQNGSPTTEVLAEVDQPPFQLDKARRFEAAVEDLRLHLQEAFETNLADA